jgi:ubiquinone/menaquinone biosynthesis C-methylase UbiE
VHPRANGGHDGNGSILSEIRDYWDQHIHDQKVATAPIGSPAFFRELESYRFEKLDYLPRLLDSVVHSGQRLLEVGCGAGIDLAHLATKGAVVTGIDLAPSAIALARRHFADRGLAADLQVMNGEQMAFPDASFDLIYAHSTLQYTADDRAMVSEIHRVLRPGGQAVLIVYHKHSWLNALSKLGGVPLEHQDAPVMIKYSIPAFRALLEAFDELEITTERFPVETRLHGGWKAAAYNRLFVSAFHRLPRSLVKRSGWHLLAFARKTDRLAQ